MKLIGLTGAIGSGKSSVSQRLAQKGALIIDGDAIAKQLQHKGSPLLDKMVHAFGDVLLPSGELDRQKVAQIVFNDAEKLKQLNGIMHPAINDEIMRQVHEQIDTQQIVVLDMPLLVENPRTGFSALVIVDIDPETAISRLVSHRKMNEDDARKRMNRQATREQRLSVADRVIDNNGELSELQAQIDDLWDWFATLPEAKAGAGSLMQKSK
jgi:dephospho-CoA kinase